MIASHGHHHPGVALSMTPLSITCIIIVVAIVITVMWQSRKENHAREGIQDLGDE